MSAAIEILKLESIASFMAEDFRIISFTSALTEICSVTICRGVAMPHRSFVLFSVEKFTENLNEKRLEEECKILRYYWKMVPPPIEMIERATSLGWDGDGDIRVARNTVHSHWGDFFKENPGLPGIRAMCEIIDTAHAESIANAMDAIQVHHFM